MASLIEPSPPTSSLFITGLVLPGDISLNYSVGSKGPPINNKGSVLTGETFRVQRLLPRGWNKLQPLFCSDKGSSSLCTSVY